MTNLYLRQTSLIVGNQSNALDLSQMQFQFRITRGDIQTPNIGRFRVYNLSQATINQLKSKEFTSIIMQGGYSGNYGTLFNGTVKYVYKGNDSAVDSFVDIVGADGDSAYNYAVVNQSLAAGSKPQDHVNLAAQAMNGMGVNYSTNTNPAFTGNPLPRGKVFYALARDVLRKVSRDCNATWSIQDGNLEFVSKSGFRGGNVVVLTSATGLIGFPRQTQNGIVIRCLINPNIKIGSQVQIDNNSIQRFDFSLSVAGTAANALVPSLDADGIYKVLWAEHQGDTRGTDYYTDLTCISIDKTAVGIANQGQISRLTAGPVPPGPVNPYQGP